MATSSAASSESIPATVSTGDSSADNTKDVAREWAEVRNPARSQRVTCKLCDKTVSGGINRLKKHLLHIKGDVTSCPNVSIEIMKKVREQMDSKKQTKAHKEHIDALYESCDLNAEEGSGDDIEVEEVEMEVVNVTSNSKKPPTGLGKRKQLCRSSDARGSLDSAFKTDVSKTQQATLDRNIEAKKTLQEVAWRKISAWMTENSIAFNVVRSPSFQEMITAIGEYGRAMPAPTYHHIRTTLFNYNWLKQRSSLMDLGCTGGDLGVQLCPMVGQMEKAVI